MDPTLAAEIAGKDPDFALRDLYNAIHNGEYPSWTFYIQVMTFEQARDFRWNIFDVTKVYIKSLSSSSFPWGSRETCVHCSECE